MKKMKIEKQGFGFCLQDGIIDTQFEVEEGLKMYKIQSFLYPNGRIKWVFNPSTNQITKKRIISKLEEKLKESL